MSGRQPGRSFLRRLAGDRSGTTAVELALVLPVFVAFLFGFFEFCWMQHCEASVRTALEETARSVLLKPSMTQSEIQTAVRARLTTLADPNVTVTESIATTVYGRVATLTATFPHTIGVPGMATYTINYQTQVVAPLPTF